MGFKLLENVYEMVCESRMVHGVEIWGVRTDGKRLIKSIGEFAKNNLGDSEICCKWGG
jgi:hypothetical protein